MLEQRAQLGAVRWRDRDTHADADDHRMAFELVGRADRLDHAVREGGRLGTRVRLDHVQDRELVAAQAPDHVGLGDHLGEPRRHRLEQQVADRVAERVVDRLEQVEVEDEDAELRAVLDEPPQRLVHLLP